MPLPPRPKHSLEQYMALTLEVQGMLRSHKADLMRAGWTEPEAWALCQRVEERILGPAIQETARELNAGAEVRALVLQMLDEERGRRA